MAAGYAGTEKGRVRTGRRGVISRSELQARVHRRELLGRAFVKAKRVAYGALALELLRRFGPRVVLGSDDISLTSSNGIKIEPVGGAASPVVASPERPVISGKNLVDVAFQNSYQEKGEIRTKVDEFKAKYKQSFSANKEAQVDKSIARASDWDIKVRDKVGRAKLPTELGDLIMGMVIVESRGDPMAIAETESQDKARGLVQIADSMARAHNMYVTGDSRDGRFNVDASLNVLVAELKEAYGRWGNWGFAIWEWHAGAPRIYEAVQEYGADWFERLPNIDVGGSFPNPTAEAGRRVSLYKQKISDWNLNVFKMFGYKKIQDMFRGEQWNKTDEYLLRVVACAELYREAKAKELTFR